MLRRFADRLSYANVMATAAMFVALGGGAYALTGIPDRSGVFRACVDDKTGALRAVARAGSCRKAKTIRRGRRRIRIPGETAIAWNQQGRQGLRGLAGTAGRSFDANATLPSGQTLTGPWFVGGGASDNLGTQVQFTPRLSADLPGTAVQRIIPPTFTTQCPGIGQAARGFFCLYEKASNATFGGIFDAVSGAGGANRTGAVITYSGTAAYTAANGTWAVTAP
jgi:hypothetical protein